MSELKSFLQAKSNIIETELSKYLNTNEIPVILQQSMSYSVDAGGKRMRPILILATIEAFGQPSEKGLPVACAVEMVHTYSLIHDDLPAMDNDDYRRGKLTNHKVFGEGMAILAGDGLLTFAFEIMSKGTYEGVPIQGILQIVRELALYAGPKGMVGGQVADLEGENKTLSLEELQYIHQHKTADLLIFCVRAGAILAGASEKQLTSLTHYAQHIGMAFQIQDDILDVMGDQEKMGKQVGSDEKLNKSTYPSLLGMEESQRLLEEHVQSALQALAEAGVADSGVLASLARFIQQRDH
ncbi:MAG TPA: hypothetical protein DDY49_07775 [Paenibacillaceae bacterium]|nr:hypothetical protein [Paenibacillaceae bacterium]